MADEPTDLPCERLPPLPQEEVKRGVEQERTRTEAGRLFGPDGAPKLSEG